MSYSPIAQAGLRGLESLIERAGRRLKELEAQNAKLSAELLSVKSENQRFREELKAAQVAARRQERVKARLERLSRKLEHIS